MKRGLVSIYSDTDEDWGLGYPFVYRSGSWTPARPYVYTGGSWKLIGGAGTNMVFLLDADENFIVDSSGVFIQVRQG